MPRLSGLVPASPPSRGTFVGREAELREFRNSIRYLLGSEPPPGNNPIYPHFFLTHGEGGMGKSELVRQWRFVAGEEGMPDERIVLVDLDSAHCPTSEALVQLLASVIGKKHLNFDQRYREARRRRDELAPRRNELHQQWQRWQALRQSEGGDDAVITVLRRRLAIREKQHAAYGIDAAPHILLDMQDARRDLDALTGFYDEHRRGPRDFDELLRREFGADADLFVDDDRALGQTLGEDLFDLAESAPLLLMLDTYERADMHDDWLRKTVLADPSDQIIVVIAGRANIDEPYRRKFSGGHSGWAAYYDLNKRRFQADDIRNYLLKRLALADDPPAELVDEVLAISRGIPLAVQALGDQLTRGGLEAYRGLERQQLDEHEVIAEVTRRFLMYLLDQKGDPPEVARQKQQDRQRIRALALLRPGQQPDEQLAGCLWDLGHDELEVAFRDLAGRHSFVFRAGLFQLHELVHAFVRADMLHERRRSADWSMLEAGLRRALALVNDRLARAEQRTTDPDERYRDAEWREAVLDKLNVLLWLQEDEHAKRLLLNRWIEARHNAPALANELSKLAAELAPETSEWRRLVEALRDAEYEEFEACAGELEQHARAVLYYLRADKLETWPTESQADFERINRKIALLEQSRTLKPEWTPTQQALAGTLSARGYHFAAIQRNMAGALADYERALDLRPDDPATLNNRGIVQAEMGDLAGALADYTRALALRPDDPATLYNRGNVKGDMGDLAGAVADYTRALDLRPDDPDTLYNRGFARSYAGDFDGALADYQRGLELSPNDVHTMYNIACLYGLQGDAEAARAWLARAIAGDEKYRALARHDSDFDTIRADPRFVALVGAATE